MIISKLNQLLFVLLNAVTITISAQTYITNVTIGDVENHKLIANQTVVITKDLITKIQPNTASIPAKAMTIDGTGKYLFPGMTDAHIHFFQNGGLYARPDAIDLRNEKPYAKEIDLAHNTVEDKLRRYLSNGITNVIDVGSTNNFLKKRDLYRDTAYAPSIFMSGPLLTTYEPKPFANLKDDSPFNLVTTVEEGIKMVQNQLVLRPDFIKIWYIVLGEGAEMEASARKNLPMVKAIIEEAHKNKLKVAVHATQRITAQLAVESGCDFLVHSVDDEVIKDDFIQLLKKNKTIVCPTLIVHQGYSNTFGQKMKFTHHDLLQSDPYQLGSLLDMRHLSDTQRIQRYKEYYISPEEAEETAKITKISTENLKKLSDAGVLIATGTDAGNIGTLHASSYLAEMKAMGKSGLSNWQVITASTINGAKVLSREADFGSITVGKKANLILLANNPIDNLDHLKNIHLVINRGVIFSPKDIIKETPEALAQRQLNAYNLRDIDAFLEPYADDVEIYTFPDKLMSKGKDAMRKGYAPMFDTTPNLHCELVNRIVEGNMVIDHERVRFGSNVIQAIAIYTIENGKIRKVYFPD